MSSPPAPITHPRGVSHEPISGFSRRHHRLGRYRLGLGRFSRHNGDSQPDAGSDPGLVGPVRLYRRAGLAGLHFSTPCSVQIAVGDTIDFSIDFAGQQTLTLTDVSTIWAFSDSGYPVSDVTGTGTLSLLDSAGNAFLTSNVKTDTEGSIHFGQQFSSSGFTGGVPASVTFCGVRYYGMLGAYVAPNLTVRDYDLPALFFTAGSNTVGLVPEPSAYAMMLVRRLGDS